MIHYIFLLLGIITTMLVQELKRRRYIYKCLKDFDGPPAKFPFGHGLNFGSNSTEILQFQYELQEKYGPICKMFSGSRTYLFISDPDLVQIILSSPLHIHKGYDYRILKLFINNGLVVSNGSTWHTRRKMLTATIHKDVLNDFLPIINSTSDSFVARLDSETSKEVINIFPIALAFALDTICETFMGTATDALNTDNEYLKAVREMGKICMARRFSSWKKYDFLFRFSKESKIMSEVIAKMHEFSRSVIYNRRKELENNIGSVQKKNMQFLDYLLKYKVDDKYLSDDEINEEVQTFLFGGHETVASTLSNTLYELAQHPDIQDKILEELRNITTDDPNCQITMEHLNQMKYLELVIKETLRKYPSIPYFTRELTQDIKYKGSTIPKGVITLIFPFHMQRRADLFEDPDEFNPDRFLNYMRHPFSYIPFSAGPRNCLGKRYAIYVLKISICKILRSYRVLPADSRYNVVLFGELSLKSRNGVCIRLEERQ